MNHLEVVKKEFIKSCYRRCLSQNRIQRYLKIFEEIEKLGINLQNLTKEDIDKYFFYLVNNKKLSQWTKVTKWKMFKKICRFVNPNIDFSEWVMKAPKTEPEILSLEEIAEMVRAANGFRDKLVILLLYESGIRLGELVNLRVKDVIFDEHGAVLRVNGKTGTRYIRVVQCAELLKVWVKFCKDKLFDVSPRMIEKIVKEAAKKAGIKKKVYPHLLRHTRATHLAKYLTEPELKVFFGWSKNSRMPDVYVHLSMRDVDSKILEIYNKAKIAVRSEVI